MSSGMMHGTHWGGRLGARPGWNAMSPFGSTLGGVAGAAYVVVSGVFTLRGGVTCGAEALVNISESCLRAAVCLYPNVVSGLVGVGLRRVWVRSTDACVAASFEDSLGKVSVSGEKYVVYETLSFSVLGM